MSVNLRRALPLWAFSEVIESGELRPMIFLTGARQVGKTHLVRELSGAYYNWDTVETKKAWIKNPYFFRNQSELVVFDEIHKRRDWKKILKGAHVRGE